VQLVKRLLYSAIPLLVLLQTCGGGGSSRY
jgi:hypothetical protein